MNDSRKLCSLARLTVSCDAYAVHYSPGIYNLTQKRKVVFALGCGQVNFVSFHKASAERLLIVKKSILKSIGYSNTPVKVTFND